MNNSGDMNPAAAYTMTETCPLEGLRLRGTRQHLRHSSNVSNRTDWRHSLSIFYSHQRTKTESIEFSEVDCLLVNDQPGSNRLSVAFTELCFPNGSVSEEDDDAEEKAEDKLEKMDKEPVAEMHTHREQAEEPEFRSLAKSTATHCPAISNHRNSRSLKGMLHAAATNKGSNVLSLSLRHLVILVFVAEFSCVSTQHIVLRLCEQLLQLHMLNTVPIIVYQGKANTLSKFLTCVDHPLAPELHFLWDYNGVLAESSHFSIHQSRTRSILLFDNEAKRRKRIMQQDLKKAAFLRAPIPSSRWSSLRLHRLPASFVISKGDVVDQYKPRHRYPVFDFVKQVLLPGMLEPYSSPSSPSNAQPGPLNLVQLQRNTQWAAQIGSLPTPRRLARRSSKKCHLSILDLSGGENVPARPNSPLLEPTTKLVPARSDLETRTQTLRKSTPRTPHQVSTITTILDFEPLQDASPKRSPAVDKLKKIRKRSQSFPALNNSDELGLDDVLMDDTCRRYYKLHVAREHCVETVLFYEHVELKYKRMKSAKQRRKLAEEIIARFLDPDGMYGVNISLALRDKVRAIYDEQGPVLDLFDPVMRHVRATCALDSFLRFRISDLWKEMMEARQRKGH